MNTQNIMQTSPDRAISKNQTKTIGLARQTILRIGAVIILVTILTTLLTYFYIFSSTETQYINQLEKYVAERGEREENLFKLIQNNTNQFKVQLLERLKTASLNDPAGVAEFDRLYEKQPDGTTRNKAGFDGTKQIGLFVHPQLTLTPEVKNRILMYSRLNEFFGVAWHGQFQNFYVADPTGALTVYWPEYPTWTQDVKADYDIPNEEWFYLSDMKHNPTRKTVWTDLYFEPVSKLFLVSSTTPIDVDGKHLASVGEDITVNELIERTFSNHLDGTSNMILSQKGQLIAHPQLQALLEKNGGKLTIDQLNDQHLKQDFELLKANVDPQTGLLKKAIINNTSQQEYLGVHLLEGPNWFFVISVPKSILEQNAFNTAQFILLLGGLTMLIELVALWLILQRLVARPLQELTKATQQVAGGNFNVQLKTSRSNELGQLAGAFNIMAEAVAEREVRLAEASEQVLSRASELKVTATQQAAGNQQQAAAITQVNASLDELSSTAHNIAILASQVKESTQGVAQASRMIYDTTNLAVTQSEQGQQAVAHTIQVSSQAARFYEQLLSEMSELQDRSNNMRHVLDLISTVAGQTHLLALNAAIEAAGAGVQGERFRIVAQEVKLLAQRSNNASQEVVGIVQEIEAVIKGVVNSVESNYSKMQELSEVAERAGSVIEQLRQVAEQAEFQATSIGEAAGHSLQIGSQIEIATQQQGSASQQVLGVLSNLSISAQQTAAESGLVSATASELEEVSRLLTTSLSFRKN